MKSTIRLLSSIWIALFILTAFMGMEASVSIAADTVSSATAQSRPDAPAASLGKPAVVAAPTAASNKDYGAIGFKLMDQEMAFLFKKGQTAAKIEKVLGKPDLKTKAQYWGADGLEHQEWSYQKKGIVLGFAKGEDKVQKLWSVTLTKPSKMKTSKGIAIGSTRQAVLKAYGAAVDPSEEPGAVGGKSAIVAGTVYGGLIFQIEKDHVVGIFIGASAE